MSKLKTWFLEKILLEGELSEEHEDWLLSRGARFSDIEKWGLVSLSSPEEPCPDPIWAKKYGAFWEKIEGALVAPVFSVLGDCIGFEWRLGERRQKVFFRNKETRPIWWGMPFEIERIWSLRKVWVVEGYLDALVLKRVTTLPVIAAGTANLSDAQIIFLERFVDEARIAFDQDKPGDMGYLSAKKKVIRKDLEFIRWEYGVKGDDPPKIWDRGGLQELKENFEGF